MDTKSEILLKDLYNRVELIEDEFFKNFLIWTSKFIANHNGVEIECVKDEVGNKRPTLGNRYSFIYKHYIIFEVKICTPYPVEYSAKYYDGLIKKSNKLTNTLNNIILGLYREESNYNNRHFIYKQLIQISFDHIDGKLG